MSPAKEKRGLERSIRKKEGCEKGYEKGRAWRGAGKGESSNFHHYIIEKKAKVGGGRENRPARPKCTGENAIMRFRGVIFAPQPLKGGSSGGNRGGRFWGKRTEQSSQCPTLHAEQTPRGFGKPSWPEINLRGGARLGGRGNPDPKWDLGEKLKNESGGPARRSRRPL